MARITEDVTYETLFKLLEDSTRSIARIEWARHMLSRRYLFVGESHNFKMDVMRRNHIAQHFSHDKTIIMVTERGMEGERGLLNSILPEREGIIHETDYESRPFNPQRDCQIVKRIISEISKDRVHKRPVLILFGQDHEQKIRNELKQQLEKDERICWWSFPSILHQIDSLEDVTYPEKGYSLVGFTAPPDYKEPAANKLLLTKGKFLGPFIIDVRAPFFSPDNLHKDQEIFAVYGLDRFPGTKYHIDYMDKKTGSCRFNAFGPEVVRLVRVANNEDYQRLRAQH